MQANRLGQTTAIGQRAEAEAARYLETRGFVVVDRNWRKLRAGGVLIVSGPTENRAYALGRWLAGFSGDYHVRSIFDVEDDVAKSKFARESLQQLPLFPRLFRITLWRRIA